MKLTSLHLGGEVALLEKKLRRCHAKDLMVSSSGPAIFKKGGLGVMQSWPLTDETLVLFFLNIKKHNRTK